MPDSILNPQDEEFPTIWARSLRTNNIKDDNQHEKIIAHPPSLFSAVQLFSHGLDSLRFYDEVFDYYVTKDIQFGEAAQPKLLNPNHVQELFLDVYQPEADTMSARPLIIWAFGGAFVFGSKQSPDIVSLSSAFAKRGYVCAAIDYRLTTDLVIHSETTDVYEAVMKATHDMLASIRYFYKDAATNNDFRIDTTWINPAKTIPIVSMHGTEDSVVPYGSDTVTILGIELAVDGSSTIHHKLTQDGVPNAFYTFEGAGHTPFVGLGAGAKAYMDTTIWFVRDFLFDMVSDGTTSLGGLPLLEQASIKVFPNPNEGSFYLDLDSDDELSIIIYDQLGKKVYEQPGLHRGIHQVALDVPEGMYTIHAYSISNQKHAFQQIIFH